MIVLALAPWAANQLVLFRSIEKTPKEPNQEQQMSLAFSLQHLAHLNSVLVTKKVLFCRSQVVEKNEICVQSPRPVAKKQSRFITGHFQTSILC